MIVLHIAPHLGGGVGKAHAVLAEAEMSRPSSVSVRHVYALLEEPRDVAYTDRLRAAGREIHIAPALDVLAALTEQADIVQIEWWNHPRLYGLLTTNYLPDMRLATWIHISSLCAPFVPRPFVALTDQTLFTSSRSLGAMNLRTAILERPDVFDVVNSGFGFETVKRSRRKPDAPIQFGYLGTLDFAKMHPRFFDLIDAMDTDICVHLWGRYDTDGEVGRRAAAMRHPQRIRFEGYTADPASVLSDLDVFVYLLAPNHYGTAENALVEAMSAGCVPVVWNNPAETSIVTDRKTGFVVRSETEFVSTIADIILDPTRLTSLREAAMIETARHYSPYASILAFENVYTRMMREPKRHKDFAKALGLNARDWFLSSMSVSGDAQSPGERLMSNTRSKGSLGHFRHCLPDDQSLASFDGAANDQRIALATGP